MGLPANFSAESCGGALAAQRSGIEDSFEYEARKRARTLGARSDACGDEADEARSMEEICSEGATRTPSPTDVVGKLPRECDVDVDVAVAVVVPPDPGTAFIKGDVDVVAVVVVVGPGPGPGTSFTPPITKSKPRHCSTQASSLSVLIGDIDKSRRDRTISAIFHRLRSPHTH